MTGLKIAWIYFRRVFFLFNLKRRKLRQIIEENKLPNKIFRFIRPYKLFIEEGNVYEKLIKLKIPIMHALRLFLGPSDESNKWVGL